MWKRLYNRELPFNQQLMPFSLITLMVLCSIGECKSCRVNTAPDLLCASAAEAILSSSRLT
jgi:hypothetical protein